MPRTLSLLSIIGLLGFLPIAHGQFPLPLSNTTSIAINDSFSPPTPAAVYASSISLSGLSSRVVHQVVVTLKGFAHAFPDDVDILLAGPGGSNVWILSDVGGSHSVSGLTFVIDDNATNFLPDTDELSSGRYKPTNVGAGDTAVAPAPTPSGIPSLSVFNGSNPNSTWSLYIVDDMGGDAGSLSGGWELSLGLAVATNGGGVSVLSSNPAPTAASPYPSTLTVTGALGFVTDVRVRLEGFSHSRPDDVDMLLVAPNGTRCMILSDVGGTNTASGLTLTLGDDATNALADAGPLSNGFFRLLNAGGGDTQPAPAPGAGTNTSFAAFDGLNPVGTWYLFVSDDTAGSTGRLANWSLILETADLPCEPGDLILSEFRAFGAGGAGDEFVEIYNPLDVDQRVSSVDGSAGYAVAAADGTTRFVITNRTVLSPRSHLLATHTGYALDAYPAGSGATATGDLTYALGFPTNMGLALFRTADPAHFTLSNRLDAAGAATETNALYREGSGYPPLTALTFGSSLLRKLTNGQPRDADSNGADFMLVDGFGGGPLLGAAGPENQSSPIRLPSGLPLTRLALDLGASLNTAPNRVRDVTPGSTNFSSAGTLSLRRRFVNLTGSSLQRIRFRVVDLSTLPATAGSADLRALSSTNLQAALSGGSTVTVFGTTLELPPAQPLGGGVNSSLSLDSVTAASPLGFGSTVNAQFLFGVQQTGAYHFAILAETFPPSASALWHVEGSTESASDSEGDVPAEIVGFAAAGRDLSFDGLGAPGRLYQLQSASNLPPASDRWTNTSALALGTGGLFRVLQTNTVQGAQQFYRLIVVP